MIEPLANVAVPSVIDPPSTAPLAVTLVKLMFGSRLTSTTSVADTAVVMFVPPCTSTVSPPSIVCEPLSAVNVHAVDNAL